MSNWLQEFFQYKAVVEANLNVTSAATVQQYFKYTYKNTVYIQGTSGTYPAAGFIHFNNADTTLATQAAMANLTSGAQGIGSYISEQNAGVHMHVRSTQTNSLGIYKIQSLPVTSTAHRYFTVSVINGIALQDGEELTVTFSSVANCIWDDTNDTITANGVAVAPNVLAVDTIADALSTVTVNATNHRKEFAVLDPGGNTANALLLPIPWNVMVDNTMGILRQMNGLSDFAMLKAAGRYCQPAVNATARATDSSVLALRTKLTITAHGLTALVAGTDTYVVVQTAGGGFTANEKLKILSIVDANNIVVDKLFADVSGNPDLYVITEVMPVETILCPALRSWSQLHFFVQCQMPSTAGTKTLSLNWGGTDYWAPSAFTTTKGIAKLTQINNLGATNKQMGQGLASSNTGLDGVQTAGNIPTSTVDTTAVTTANFNIALSAAADYVEVERITASARW